MAKTASNFRRNMPDWDQNLKKSQPKPAPSKEAISKGYAFPKCIQNINPCMNLRKLVDLLENPISRGDVGRQLQLLDDFLDTSSYAFWLRDIPFHIRLLEAIVIKNKSAPKFEEQLKRLFSLALVPPMLVKPSEQLEYRRDFHHYFSVLGYLIVCLKNHELKHSILDVLKGLLTRNKPVGYCCVSLEYCKEAANDSDLPEIVAQLSEVVPEDLYEKLLEVAIVLAESSKDSCKRMIKEHVVEFVLQRLEPHWHERDCGMRPELPLKDGDGVIMHCEDSTRLLWLLFNTLEKGTKDLKLSDFALWSLHYAFRTSVLNNGQKTDRNNLAALILKLLQVSEPMDIEESGIAADIALLSVASEIATKNTWACPVHFSIDYKDFYFKKILVSTLPYLLQHGAVGSLRDCDVVKGLILILKRPRMVSWRSDQHCEFILLAIKVLSLLAGGVCTDDEAKRISKWILNFLGDCKRNRFDTLLLLSGLRCLNNLFPIAFKYIKDMKGFKIILSLTKSIMEESGYIITRTLQRCLAYCFMLLEQIYVMECEKATMDGVDLCLYVLKIIIDPDQCEIHAKIIVSALHFMWDIMEDSSANASYFIKQGGLYNLLDVIYLTSEQIRLPALGVLVPVSMKRASIPYLITWRKHGTRIMSLLMQLFRGGIQPTVCKDSNKIQYASEQINYLMSMCHDRNMNPPPVAEGHFVDLYRSKVFCILKVFKKYRENVEYADESYSLFKEELTFEDQITKMVAQNFLSLQLCDAWIDLDASIKQDDVLLVAADHEELDDVTTNAKKWKWHLKRLLEEQYELYKFKDHQGEMQFYNRLNESNVAEALDAMKEMRRVVCCTERTFFLTKRIAKSRDMEKMLFKTAEQNYHKTEPLRFPVAHVFDQTVEIESNKIHKEEEVIDFDLVSLDEDELLSYEAIQDCLSCQDVPMCIDDMD